MIESIVGLMSSGKTLLMTYKLYLEWLKGRTIITNYDVNFPHYKVNQDWLLNVVSDENVVINNVAFGLDELWLWLMDSRNSMGKEQKIASYFFLQSSKDDSQIFITAQDNTQNDKRLRDNLHRITQCNRVIWTGDTFVDISEEDRFLEQKFGDWINDYLFIKAETFTRSMKMGVPILKLKERLFVPARPVFNLFDTRKKIRPVKKQIKNELNNSKL